jgi:hypothetical protein
MYTRLGTTRNYSVIADIHSLQIIRVHPFTDCCVFISRSLATSSNSGDSSASHAQVVNSQPPVQNSTEFIAPTVVVITSRYRPHRKHHAHVIDCVSVAAGTCLPSCCPETAGARNHIENIVLLLRACMLRALPCNSRCLQNHCLVTGLYAKICIKFNDDVSTT